MTRAAEKLTVINERRSVDQLVKVCPPKTVTSKKFVKNDYPHDLLRAGKEKNAKIAFLNADDYTGAGSSNTLVS